MMRSGMYPWISAIVYASFFFGVFEAYTQEPSVQTDLEGLADPPWVMSDSVCQWLSRAPDHRIEPSESQKERSLKAFGEGWKLWNQYKRSQDIQHLLQAQPYFEEALRWDISNENYRTALNAVYGLLENHYRREEDYERAILFGERLRRLSPQNEKDYALYLKLGQSYFQSNELNHALLNFRKAEKYMANPLQDAESSADTTAMTRLKNVMFNILVSQIRVYEAIARPDDVKRIVEKAFVYAEDETKRRNLDYFKYRSNGWLFWDDKEAMEIEIEIGRRINGKNYEEACDLYEKLCSKFPSTEDRRRVEAERRYALFEYQYLNLNDRAIQRLLPWALGKDTLSHVGNIRELYNTFSFLCYNHGRELTDKNRFTAYCYFHQGLIVPSDFSSKIKLALLGLSQNDPREMIRLGADVWEKRADLTETERRWLCEQLISAFKRSGNPEETRRYFEEYQRLIQ